MQTRSMRAKISLGQVNCNRQFCQLECPPESRYIDGKSKIACEKYYETRNCYDLASIDYLARNRPKVSSYRSVGHHVKVLCPPNTDGMVTWARVEFVPSLKSTILDMISSTPVKHPMAAKPAQSPAETASFSMTARSTPTPFHAISKLKLGRMSTPMPFNAVKVYSNFDFQILIFFSVEFPSNLYVVNSKGIMMRDNLTVNRDLSHCSTVNNNKNVFG